MLFLYLFRLFSLSSCNPEGLYACWSSPCCCCDSVASGQRVRASHAGRARTRRSHAHLEREKKKQSGLKRVDAKVSWEFLNFHLISALISPPASYRACASFGLGFFLLCDAPPHCPSPPPPHLPHRSVFETAMFRNILFMCVGGLIRSLMRRRRRRGKGTSRAVRCTLVSP